MWSDDILRILAVVVPRNGEDPVPHPITPQPRLAGSCAGAAGLLSSARRPPGEEGPPQARPAT